MRNLTQFMPWEEGCGIHEEYTGGVRASGVLCFCQELSILRCPQLPLVHFLHQGGCIDPVISPLLLPSVDKKEVLWTINLVLFKIICLYTALPFLKDCFCSKASRPGGTARQGWETSKPRPGTWSLFFPSIVDQNSTSSGRVSVRPLHRRENEQHCV